MTSPFVNAKELFFSVWQEPPLTKGSDCCDPPFQMAESDGDRAPADRPSSIEERARRAASAGAHAVAATLLLQAYGPEISSLLRWQLKSAGDAAEVFSDFTEDLWRGLPSFHWQSSARTWLYVLARHAASRFRRSPQRRRQTPLSHAGSAAEVPANPRTATPPFARSDVKAEMRRLREQLPEPDQMLLVLRIDRGLSWRDLALVFAEGSSTPEELSKLECKLRKRFQLAKEKLRSAAREAGLLG